MPALIISVSFILCSHLIISVFLGEKWLDLIPVFRIASLGMVFMSYNRIGDCFFRSLGIVKEYFYVRVVVCMLSVVSIYFGCKYGIYGLAVSVMIAKFVESMVKTVFFQIRLRFAYSEFFRRMIIVGALPVILLCILMALQIYGQSVFYDVVSLTLFLGLLAIFVKIRPAILGKNFNTYVINKYFKRWI